jgi:hypothetical protein
MSFFAMCSNYYNIAYIMVHVTLSESLSSDVYKTRRWCLAYGDSKSPLLSKHNALFLFFFLLYGDMGMHRR